MWARTRMLTKAVPVFTQSKWRGARVSAKRTAVKEPGDGEAVRMRGNCQQVKLLMYRSLQTGTTGLERLPGAGVPLNGSREPLDRHVVLEVLKL